MIGAGITSDQFIDICHAYMAAWEADAPLSKRQLRIARRCSAFSRACTKLGLVALIDEATGYQEVRHQKDLEIKLQAYLSADLHEWEKTFPDELWRQFKRLTGHQGSIYSRPKWWGHLVNKLIYDCLDPDVAAHLRENKPKPRKGQNYHQWLTSDYGLPKLNNHIQQVIGIAKTCQTLRQLQEKMQRIYGNQFSLAIVTEDAPEMLWDGATVH